MCKKCENLCREIAATRTISSELTGPASIVFNTADLKVLEEKLTRVIETPSRREVGSRLWERYALAKIISPGRGSPAVAHRVLPSCLFPHLARSRDSELLNLNSSYLRGGSDPHAQMSVPIIQRHLAVLSRLREM